MHAATHSWVTAHGLKILEREQADLRQWATNLKWRLRRSILDRKKNKEIDLILWEKDVINHRLQRTDAAIQYARALPPMWGHKTDARAGDTIYLRHGDHIRAVLLAAGCDADPVNGKISVASPIGSALVGRHAGDTVRLNTLDGRLDYQILKIV